MQLNLEMAEAIAKGAMARAQGLGIRVTIAVVDAAGIPVYLARMDGTSFLTPYTAQGKAFVSAAYGKSSQEIEQMAQARPAFWDSVSTMTQGRAVFGRGALPIVFDGRVLGAAGAGGGTPEQDEEVVRAGISAVGGQGL